MTTLATITGQAYRAAFAVKADNKDVRYYLRGLYIDTDNRQIVATNGAMLYHNDIELGDEPSAPLIFEAVKIPAGADTVEVCRHDDGNVMLHVSGPRTGTTMHVCPIIEGRYPDYKAVIPKTGSNRSAVGFDVKNLAVLKTIFKRRAEFTFVATSGACKITGAEGEGTCVLMEMRA